jgi:hypothetical protein
MKISASKPIDDQVRNFVRNFSFRRWRIWFYKDNNGRMIGLDEKVMQPCKYTARTKSDDAYRP